MTGRYRLEWPAHQEGSSDRWEVADDPAGARRLARRLLLRKRGAVPWVRVVQLGVGGDVADAFVDRSSLADWTGTSPLPCLTGSPPVAAPEIERLRTRALAGLDVVTGWSVRRGILPRIAAEHVRLVFDAAMLGVISDVAP